MHYEQMGLCFEAVDEVDLSKPKKRKEKNQHDLILDIIKENGYIDRISSFFEAGIFELSARICELEKQGYKFDKKRKTMRSKRGNTFNCVEYRIIGVPENVQK